ncbi:hypothetical protein [uncultured Pseudodesulfovibrio sp.]|uniref:hypothetical protein n=1 Tax=uncultured Pseudodesulfovibrio sp. TaxID=2035858 RepID=UPI0029C86CA5|nr:hypothetical protein [uncultured Pseudodesulfovibrio sp.]
MTGKLLFDQWSHDLVLFPAPPKIDGCQTEYAITPQNEKQYGYCPAHPARPTDSTDDSKEKQYEQSKSYRRIRLYLRIFTTGVFDIHAHGNG